MRFREWGIGHKLTTIIYSPAPPASSASPAPLQALLPTLPLLPYRGTKSILMKSFKKILFMSETVVQRFPNLSHTLVLAIAGLMGSISSVTAQQALPVCQPPSAGEYLLLIVSPTANNQKQLRNALPTEIKSTTCQYLTETVTRIGGFYKIDDANRWARYINNIVGLSGIITTRPADVPPPQTVTYNPQALGAGYAVLVDYFSRLGAGYAVLVDYFSRPELVSNVQQVVGGDVGFASYGQRPYLLAVYTTNQTEAYNTLQKLNERGFVAYLVDSRKVMLLRSNVRLQ